MSDGAGGRRSPTDLAGDIWFVFLASVIFIFLVLVVMALLGIDI